MASDRNPTAEILREIADREGVAPYELERPLYEVIDPEALNSLFANSTEREGADGIRLEFSYYGYDVTVESPGRVDVELSTMEPGPEPGPSEGSTVD